MALVLYQNKEWLGQKYLNEKLTTSQISKICGINRTKIWRWLVKFGIPCRSSSYSRILRLIGHCNLTSQAINWLNGELLGDGNLSSKSLYTAHISYGSKYFEYLEYISKILASFGIVQSGKIRTYFDKRFNVYVHRYASRAYMELSSIRKKWYPEGKKIVPRDLELTPLTCRQWYIGDGYLGHHVDCRPTIELFTGAFPVSDTEFLCKQLRDLGFKVSIARTGVWYKIYISVCSTRDFLSYIGKCPVNCYAYKWAY